MLFKFFSTLFAAAQSEVIRRMDLRPGGKSHILLLMPCCLRGSCPISLSMDRGVSCQSRFGHALSDLGSQRLAEEGLDFPCWLRRTL